MRVSKKVPIRQRGHSDEVRQHTKSQIRDAFANGPKHEVQIIPAKRDIEPEGEKRKLRVCAYCRVSTEEDNQAGSYELQVQNYTEMISSNEDWEFAGIYADEGISATSTLHRENFLEMIERCKAGEIDLIITKQISRFARNVRDSLNTIFMLRQLDPPVGVYFEDISVNSLDKASDMIITVLSLVAQEESEQKSNSLKWSFKRRRARGLGIYPSWCLLGYEKDKDGNWVIVEEEAEIVQLIYNLYLEGYPSTLIADTLTKSGIPTVRGKERWSAATVISILRNEKYCGDALCQKTVTIDFFTHKSVKNDGRETQYYVQDHHEPIIERKVWLAVQKLLKERRTHKGPRRRRKPRVVVKGPFAGFIVCDPNWRAEDIDTLFADPTPISEEPDLSELEDDPNFYIERE